ncbi:RagB/SusD family nutrient uptake outer membrane protein [Sinomicrobium sp. M5D2P9]
MKVNIKYKRQTGRFNFRFLWISFLSILVLCTVPSCEDFVEIDPPISELVSETVYTNDENAEAAIRGIYSGLLTGFASGGLSSITFLGGVSADELDEFSQTADLLGFYTNELTPENGRVNSIWGSFYNIIYQTNAVLEGLDNSTAISTEVSMRLEGEAKFLRAFCYFYLANLWHDVPLITSTNLEENRFALRTSISEVYELIVKDLKDAEELLPENYAHAGGERTRVNKSVAFALLARCYLYLGEWDNAEIHATEVIENSNYFLEDDLNNVFLKNSNEAIWQLKPSSGNTNEGGIFILTTGAGFAALSDHVMDAFELEDERKINWTGNFTNDTGTWNYPFKYKISSEPNPDNVTEYSMILRLAEQYFIRAEARVQQGKISGAQEDLNSIRNRAGLENTTAGTQAELLDAILQERHVELFTEWGHRWLDLKRTENSGEVLGPIKSGWENTDVLWPIPQTEIDNNPNLIQNTGY